MRLSQLETLVHVAELGSLSRAAERLHIAQPALSRQVRLLERELGMTLFDRHGRGNEDLVSDSDLAAIPQFQVRCFRIIHR